MQLQFKHVFRDYVIPHSVQRCGVIKIGSFLITDSHLKPKTIDMGVVTALHSVEEFIELKKHLGRSQDEEENFLGTVIRVASMKERMRLPVKWKREGPTLVAAQWIASKLNLVMDLYEAEYQFDGKVLYLYYRAENRVDYRELVHEVSQACGGVRVKMKKTDQCRKFIPHGFAKVSLATGISS